MRNVTRTCLAATSLLLGLAGLAAAASPEIKIGADRRIRISDDWRFFKGEADGADNGGKIEETAVHQWNICALPG